MDNELFYPDGETGQVILPVLCPGIVHSSRWIDRFLRLIATKSRAHFPHMAIHVRADVGFSAPAFFQAIDKLDIGFCVGISSKERHYTEEDPEKLYRDYYVKRGEAEENRIKEIKYFSFRAV